VRSSACTSMIAAPHKGSACVGGRAKRTGLSGWTQGALERGDPVKSPHPTCQRIQTEQIDWRAVPSETGPLPRVLGSIASLDGGLRAGGQANGHRSKRNGIMNPHSRRRGRSGTQIGHGLRSHAHSHAADWGKQGDESTATSDEERRRRISPTQPTPHPQEENAQSGHTRCFSRTESTRRLKSLQ
jgi:hypothetical protein